MCESSISPLSAVMVALSQEPLCCICSFSPLFFFDYSYLIQYAYASFGAKIELISAVYIYLYIEACLTVFSSCTVDRMSPGTLASHVCQFIVRSRFVGPLLPFYCGFSGMADRTISCTRIQEFIITGGVVLDSCSKTFLYFFCIKLKSNHHSCISAAP